MHRNWMKLTNKLKLILVVNVTFSVSLISGLTFINLTGSSNSLLAQNNSGRTQNNSGNDNIERTEQQGNGNSLGGRGNNNSRSNSDNNYYDGKRQIRTNGYTERDNRNQPNTNCYGGNFDNKSVCGNVDTMNN